MYLPSKQTEPLGGILTTWFVPTVCTVVTVWGGKSCCGHSQMFLVCVSQIFKSTLERRLILDFSEVMFAMKHFEQVSKPSLSAMIQSHLKFTAALSERNRISTWFS